MMDIASRWCEIDIIFEITSKQTIKSFKSQWIDKHGAPKKLLSDQGRQFISLEFKNFTDAYNIKHVLTNAHNPTANSIVERANSSIGNVARISKNSTLNQLKTNILTFMNYTTNRTTKFSPFELINGYNPFNAIKKLGTNAKEEQVMRTKQSIAREELSRNKKRLKYVYEVGSNVFKRNFDPDKLAEKWLGPFTVLKVINENMIEIEESNKITKQNVKNLKPDFSSKGAECRNAKCVNVDNVCVA
jgi:transposase InsO family protein